MIILDTQTWGLSPPIGIQPGYWVCWPVQARCSCRPRLSCVRALFYLPVKLTMYMAEIPVSYNSHPSFNVPTEPSANTLLPCSGGPCEMLVGGSQLHTTAECRRRDWLPTSSRGLDGHPGVFKGVPRTLVAHRTACVVLDHRNWMGPLRLFLSKERAGMSS